MPITNLLATASSFGSLLAAPQLSGDDDDTFESSSLSYAFEHVYAQLTPFQYPVVAGNQAGNHPLSPVIQTGGVIFPYNPSISEGVNVKYDAIELTHTNESYNAYKGTDNVRITISDAVWTADTFSNAIYMLSVLHFFRSYSLMDFGRFRTGRPPSPMWFSAYGNYAFNRVPCLMEKADWSFPNDIDYVGIPEPGTEEFRSGVLKTTRNGSGKYTWLPVKFTVSSISLIVQHSPAYWTHFSLEDYWSGAMLSRGNGTFHQTNMGIASAVTTPTTPPAPPPAPTPTPPGFGGGSTTGGGASGSF
jgi:hypothetical protein